MSRGELRVEKVEFADAQGALSHIRLTVFVEEQGVPATLEMDGFDAESLHVLACLDGAPVGTGRLQPDGHIGRVAVLAAFRRRGIGVAIMKRLVELARLSDLDAVHLSSQAQAIGFYEGLGFEANGDLYVEAGIDHMDMRMRF